MELEPIACVNLHKLWCEILSYKETPEKPVHPLVKQFRLFERVTDQSKCRKRQAGESKMGVEIMRL